MTFITITKRLPTTVVIDGCFCSGQCQFYVKCQTMLSFDREILGSTRSGDVLDEATRAGIKTIPGISASLVRTRWCCDTFGYGEQPEQTEEQPVDIQPRKTSLTDPTVCPLCGRLADVGTIKASTDSTTIQITYFCRSRVCAGRQGFTKEWK